MTWSVFALFLARRTKFAFNIGHFLIILPFHSLLATFQVSITLIFDLFWSHCFGWNRSKVVLGSKLMNTFMHGPSFFSFHFFSFSILFPKLNIFTILRIYIYVSWERSSWKLVEKFHISAFPHVLFSIYLDWRAWNYKTKKKFALNPEKRTQKQAKKDMNEMEWHKMDYLIFSAMRMRKRHLFCTSRHHNVPYEKQQELNKGSEPWYECPC